jgi:prepilin-type N-terminal cleavage/methylation domain-containing protein
MRKRRAFSLIEVVVVLGLVGTLSLVAVSVLTNVRRESQDRTARTALESVAGAQETYHLDRGRWAVSSDAMAAFSRDEFTVTSGASYGPSVVSIGEVIFQGHDALGLAILDGNANCLTLVILPPEIGGSANIQRRPGGNCTGTSAGQP